MRDNRAKIVAFQPIASLAAGAQAVLAMTIPVDFIGKRLVIDCIDAGAASICIVDSLTHDNRELKAGGPIVSTAFAAPAVMSGGVVAVALGEPLEFTEPFIVGQRCVLTVTNTTPNPIAVLAYWVTAYGDKSCSCG
jgi:hypothetical protein